METFTVQEPLVTDYEAFLSMTRAKEYCRVTWTVEDSLFSDLRAAAVDLVSSYLRRPILKRRVKTIYQLPHIAHDGWFGDLDRQMDPDCVSRRVLLPSQPVISVVSVHHGAQGTLTLIPTSSYVVDLARGMIEWTVEFPFSGASSKAELHVVYEAGYVQPTSPGSYETPAIRAMRVAVAETILFLYENRGASQAKLPAPARALLNPYWRSPLNQRHRYARPR